MGRGRPGTGVEALANSIRIRFTWQGQRHCETLDLTPNAANMKAAVRLARDVRDAIRSGTFDYARFFPKSAAVKTPITFGEYADRWLETLTVQASTAGKYKLYVGIWKRALGDRTLASLKYTDIAKAVADRAKLVTGKSVNNSLHPLRAIFEAAVADDEIAVSPASRVKSLKHQAPKPDPLSQSEMAAVLAYMRERYPEPAFNYFDFAFRTGLRTSELIALEWGNIDWSQRTVTVRVAKVGGVTKGTKTHSERVVDLTPLALAALARQKAHTFMRGGNLPVFANPVTREPWASDRQQRETYWHPCLKALGIRKRDAYQTRHTYATHALMGDVNVAYIARQLGHTNTAMLFKHYAKWIDGADNERQRVKMANLYASPKAIASEAASVANSVANSAHSSAS